MRQHLSTYSLFYSSLFFGLLIWELFRVVLPIDPPVSLLPVTIYFMVASLLALILGFWVVPKRISKPPIVLVKTQLFFKLLIGVVALAYLARYVDLFLYRNVSFSNTLLINKGLISDNFKNVPIWLSMTSTFRGLYFIPLIYCICCKTRSKKAWVSALALVVLSFPEIALFGTRKPIFQLLLMVLFAVIATYGFSLLLKTKSIIILLFAGLILASFSYVVISKRVDDYLGSTQLTGLFESRYNDFVPFKESFKEDILSAPPESALVNVKMFGMHTGQYVVHGVYEFNNLFKQEDLQFAKGVYTFYPVFKFLNKVGLYDGYNASKNFNPRAFVYLTGFGTLYLDFGWYAIVFFFFFGMFQKVMAQMAGDHKIFKALWIYILIINLSLPVMSLLRGSGIYPFFGFFLLVIVYEFYFKIKKSISS